MIDISQCDSIWTKFLELWPVEKVRGMTLPQYHTLSDQSSFVRCLESMTDKLGSIWGGNAFKFGIYQRGNTEVSEKKSRGFIYGEKYAWRSCLGSSPEEAFAVVKKNVLSIIEAVQARNLEAVTADALWPMVAWKIAFLYQDRQNPQLVCVYRRERLTTALGDAESSSLSTAELYRRLMDRRGERNLFAYSEQIWSRKTEVEALTPALKRCIPLNQILYGPPGTGKTYATVDRALEIFAASGMKGIGQTREEKKQCFDRLAAKGHIRFVTFHQSFSYEDFVEGIRAFAGENGNVGYAVEDGIFKELCNTARSRIHRIGTDKVELSGRRIWKMSLGNTQGEDAYIYDECLKNSYVLLGYGGCVDFSSCRTEREIHEKFKSDLPEQIGNNDYAVGVVNKFCRRMKVGDIVVVSDGNRKFRAVGEITGGYRVMQREGDSYGQCRNVRWLCTFSPSRPVEDVMTKNFSQITLYELGSDVLDAERLEMLLQGRESGEDEALPYVLIIDEINRGNIARIFGELITLIEDSRREVLPGSSEKRETLWVHLPYSRDKFTVPENVYIIGTMNTADRSLTGLDIALRRRFFFEEVPPQPQLLESLVLDEASGISLGKILSDMNQRISVLLDRDHRIGHAPFMRLLSGFSLNDEYEKGRFMRALAEIFRRQTVPLLEEYFFEDWQKIQWVLNDHRKKDKNRFLHVVQSNESLFGDSVSLGRPCEIWEWSEPAFQNLASYIQISDAAVEPEDVPDMDVQEENAEETEENVLPEDNAGMKRDDFAEYDDFIIERYRYNNNFPIRIRRRNGPDVESGKVRKVLRQIAAELGITLTGNTQHMGAQLIRWLKEHRPQP